MIDTYTKVAFAKLYDQKNALIAADVLNSAVVPWMEEQEVRILRTLTDRGTEYCGRVESHDYQLYLALEDIDHIRTKAKSPQTNGICGTPGQAWLNKLVKFQPSNAVLRGHYHYYGITGNYKCVSAFYRHMKKTWRRYLSRRSQRSYINWGKYVRILDRFPLTRPYLPHSEYG